MLGRALIKPKINTLGIICIVLSNKKNRFPTDKLHNEFEIHKVQDLVNQEILTFVHNFFTDRLPSAFNNYYETLVTTHGINTRHGSILLRKIRHNTKMGALSIKIHGVELWNKLDNNLKSIPYVKCFRLRYKKSIIPYSPII